MVSAGMAEMEGFLCPLCKQECRSVHELETHYRKAHDTSATSKIKFKKKEFISFFENAFKISPKQTRAELSPSVSEEGGAVLEPVTNVSGISTEYWPPQEMGKCQVAHLVLPLTRHATCTGLVQEHTTQFRRAREVCLVDVSVATNRVVNRLEKVTA